MNRRIVTMIAALTLALPGIAADKKMAAPATPGAEMMAKMMKMTTPGADHQLLSPLVGKWNATVRMWMAPGAKAEESKGTSENSHGDAPAPMYLPATTAAGCISTPKAAMENVLGTLNADTTVRVWLITDMVLFAPAYTVLLLLVLAWVRVQQPTSCRPPSPAGCSTTAPTRCCALRLTLTGWSGSGVGEGVSECVGAGEYGGAEALRRMPGQALDRTADADRGDHGTVS